MFVLCYIALPYVALRPSLHFSSGWLQTLHVAQADLEFEMISCFGFPGAGL